MFFPSPLALLVSFDTRFRPGALIRFGIGIGRCFFSRCCGRRGLGLARRLLLRRNERLRRVTRLGDHSTETFFWPFRRQVSPGAPGGPPCTPARVAYQPLRFECTGLSRSVAAIGRHARPASALPVPLVGRTLARPSLSPTVVHHLPAHVTCEAGGSIPPQHCCCCTPYLSRLHCGVRTDALRPGCHPARCGTPFKGGRNFCYKTPSTARSPASAYPSEISICDSTPP